MSHEKENWTPTDNHSDGVGRLSRETSDKRSWGSDNSLGSTEDGSHRNLPSDSTDPTQTSRSPRRRRLVQATELRFQPIKGRDLVARLALLLCNISDRPLTYKFKTDSMKTLSALPSATGHIGARGSARVVFTWQRTPDEPSWQEAVAPKLLLVTRFVDGNGANKRDVTSTRLIGVLDPKATCEPNNPPLEQLLLDAVAKNLNREGPSPAEMTVTSSDPTKLVVEREEVVVAEAAPPPPEGLNGQSMLLGIFLVLLLLALYRLSQPATIVVR